MAQNAPISPDLVFGAVGHNAIPAFAKDLPPGMPMVIYDRDGNIIAAVNEKGVRYQARAYDERDRREREIHLAAARDLRQKLIAEANSLSPEQASIVLACHSEVPFSVGVLQEAFANTDETEIAVMREDSESEPTLADIEFLDAAITSPEAQINYVDLSGMSLITNRVQNISDNELSQFVRRHPGENNVTGLDGQEIDKLKKAIQKGAQEFFQKWLFLVAAIQEKHGGNTCEYGGDGLKVLDRQGKPRPLKEWVKASLECAGQWDNLIDDLLKFIEHMRSF
jgi:hypothetical protein